VKDAADESKSRLRSRCFCLSDFDTASLYSRSKTDSRPPVELSPPGVDGPGALSFLSADDDDGTLALLRARDAEPAAPLPAIRLGPGRTIPLARRRFPRREDAKLPMDSTDDASSSSPPPVPYFVASAYGRDDDDEWCGG
jgi:hypothetical protein